MARLMSRRDTRREKWRQPEPSASVRASLSERLTAAAVVDGAGIPGTATGTAARWSTTTITFTAIPAGMVVTTTAATTITTAITTHTTGPRLTISTAVQA